MAGVAVSVTLVPDLNDALQVVVPQLMERCLAFVVVAAGHVSAAVLVTTDDVGRRPLGQRPLVQ